MEFVVIPIIIFLLSIGLQLTAAVFALLLIRTTGRKLAWIFIALAMVLMAVHRLVSFVSSVSAGKEVTFEIPELIALLISSLMLIGVLRIGEYFVGEFTSTPIIKDRKIIGEYGIAWDITGRRKTEESMKESEKRYKTLLESVTDYIYTVEIKNGRPVSTKHGIGCASVTGYTSEEYEADPYLWYRMIYKEDRKAVIEQANRILLDGFVPPLEHRIIHKDGSIRWVRNAPVARYDRDGKFVAYDGLISDITERKKMEEHIFQSKHDWEDTFNTITDMITVHDKGISISSTPIRLQKRYLDYLF